MDPVPDPGSVFSRANPDSLAPFLERADRDLIQLGQFVSKYIAFPGSMGLTERSSIREDSVIQEVDAILSDVEGDIKIIDVCSGFAVVATKIIESIGQKAGRIHYWAIDGDRDCIDTVGALRARFENLASFTPVLREASDIHVCDPGSVNLIILNNALHEIQPRAFSTMFASFAKMLTQPHGRICIVDMAQLPGDAPESIAIVWNADEVATFLNAGGFRASATNHQKSVLVFRVVAHPPEAPIDKAAMDDSIRKQLTAKLQAAIRHLRGISQRRTDVTRVKEWIVGAGTVARLAEELDSMRV